MSTLLADIGGTHARFAIADGETPDAFSKLRADDFSNLKEAIAHYLQSIKVKPTHFKMATAAWPDEKGVYIFAEDRDWSLDISDIKGLGMDVDLVANDFLATSYGALNLPTQDRQLLRGKPDTLPKGPVAILGPGTGLGLSYALPDGQDGWRVQPTFGGHMLAAAHTDEQHEICRAIAAIKTNGQAVVYEDVVSGRGLPLLYKAVCKVAGIEGAAGSSAEILERKDDRATQETLRLFHEFFGLFIHTAVLTLHAHGGVFIHGGLIDILQQSGRFDTARVESSFLLQNVPSVSHVLRDIPFYYVDHSFIALYGLVRMK